ncbi:MAG: hypothetical protein AMXMBFR16_00630 [Candidatus Uhrbacteria bacterium]|uniref:Uncharacterized protein n=1 Tax=candidate division WWE3 bacterium TaxID=2053526 RepID=A0A928TS40_UNCKA|nr:hypothetical protein [candidate division WWE3 bacterium]RIL00935.1 MAG: hypothetical protein DCC77_00110 [Candidatus Uhrbacteria bacterium]
MLSFFNLFSPMVYEKVNQPVEVLAAFRNDRTEPMTFKWGKKYYQIRKVNLVHSEHNGREKVYYFSVSDDANAYRLSFRTESLKWMLEEICEAT